jgi:hypothetical protein
VLPPPWSVEAVQYRGAEAVTRPILRRAVSQERQMQKHLESKGPLQARRLGLMRRNQGTAEHETSISQRSVYKLE